MEDNDSHFAVRRYAAAHKPELFSAQTFAGAQAGLLMDAAKRLHLTRPDRIGRGMSLAPREP
jgi:hypothetical protein